MKNCGRCKSFTKMKSMSGNSGLCNLHDCRTNADYGHGCQEFKAKKFNRLIDSPVIEAVEVPGLD